jgi:preprotein translocase subunit YajC
MFITPAFAQDAAATATETGMAGVLGPMMPLLMVLVVFYFIVLRPQNKRLQQHRNLIDNLQKGDKVITGGGLIATVKKVTDSDEIVLELAQGVEVVAVRSTIIDVRK